MIKLVRVDHRLLHGQVAFSWTNGVGADCILVASDMVATSDVWKTTLRLGKPTGVKLVMKNMQDSIEAISSGITDKYKMIIVVQTIKDAKQVIEGCSEVQSINLGNTKETGETKQISRQVFVTKEEEAILRELIDRGIEIEIRPLVDDKKIYVKDVL